jgi:hypothetical protein
MALVYLGNRDLGVLGGKIAVVFQTYDVRRNMVTRMVGVQRKEGR